KRKSFLTPCLRPSPRTGALAPRRGSSVNSQPSHRRARRVWDDISNVRRNTKGEKTMNARGYTTSFAVEQSPEEVFAAINNVRGWWSGEIDGSTDKLGAEFRYRYQDVHDTTQQVTEWVPGKRVVWHVVDSHINFVKDGTEWNGTDIVFEIDRKNGQTELRFTHVGLVPTFECYGECSGAWGFYINDSLRSLITTGKGHPNPAEEVSRQ